MFYQVQVRGEWAGSVGGWRPAIDGTLNQTGWPAEAASTFGTYGAALDVATTLPGWDDGKVRIVQVQS